MRSSKICILFVLLSFSLSVFAGSLESKEVIEFENQTSLEVNFFPHLKPTIDQFLEGRQNIINALKVIGARPNGNNFIPSRNKVNIYISRTEMRGGQAFWSNYSNAFFIAYNADPIRIKNTLFSIFELANNDGPFQFFIHNGATQEQFNAGRAVVQSVIDKFLDRGFTLKDDRLYIGIAPRAMYGGRIVIDEGKIYVSIEASAEEIEQYLIAFFQYQ